MVTKPIMNIREDLFFFFFFLHCSTGRPTYMGCRKIEGEFKDICVVANAEIYC